MFMPDQSSPLTKLRRAGRAQDMRRIGPATAKGIVVVGLLLILLMTVYEIGLHLLHDLRIHLGCKE